MRINSPFVIIHAAIISVFVVATGRAPAAEIPNIKLSDGAAQVLIKQTVCEGAVALIVGLRAAGQIKGVLARLPDNVAKTATKLAHTRLMILHADTKTFLILMKD